MRDADRYRLLGTYRTPTIVRLALALFLTISPFAGIAFGFPLARLVPALTGLYADARVGDWVSFKSTIADTTTKRTVVRRTAVSISIRHESDAKAPPVDRTIEFTGPKAKDDATVEVLDTGKETLTIAGKKYDCEWTKTKITYPGQVSLTARRSQSFACRLPDQQAGKGTSLVRKKEPPASIPLLPRTKMVCPFRGWWVKPTFAYPE